MDFPLDDYAAIALLLFFGIKTLVDANAGVAGAEDAGEGEEAEAKQAVEMFEAPGAVSAFVLSTFVLVFAAEWGDKSFLATIALAVRIERVPAALLPPLPPPPCLIAPRCPHVRPACGRRRPLRRA